MAVHHNTFEIYIYFILYVFMHIFYLSINNNLGKLEGGGAEGKDFKYGFNCRIKCRPLICILAYEFIVCPRGLGLGPLCWVVFIVRVFWFESLLCYNIYILSAWYFFKAITVCGCMDSCRSIPVSPCSSPLLPLSVEILHLQYELKIILL